MAKRYYSFEELEAVLSGKSSLIFKPGGTLGRHHLEIKNGVSGIICARGTERSRDYNEDWAEHVINYDVNEYTHLSDWVVVRRGGTLGYNCGYVWSIKPMSEMSPLQAFRHKYKLPREHVIIIDEDYKIETEKLESCVSDNNPHANRNRFWGRGETILFSGEDCVVTEYHSFHGGTDQRRKLHKVYLRKDKTTAAIAEASRAIDGRTHKTNIKHIKNDLLFAP